ncbi:complement factor H-related protein 1-like [Clinocottus analis]|uniref:complement factor H-related protein 1-like n=1 Tax=Clinocottus analis TaxID=304258 RepID=UPI0035BFCD5D
MCARRYLGFVLLVWFQGVLHVRTSTRPCSAPGLNGGYWVPEQDTYNHKAKIVYGCDNGRKPAVEGWWAKSTCEDGTWSPKPQCIDENACLPPSIPNAIYTVSTNGWYENKTRIRITCDKGYQDKQRDATAQCINGNWISMPVCEKSVLACGAPPQIPHAVIIFQGYQDVFAVDTELQYECEDGYSVDGSDTKTSIYCISGNWTEGPVCSKWGRGPGTEHGGSGHATSAASGTQSERGVYHCGNPPVVPNAAVVGIGEMSLRYQCSIYYKLVGPEVVVCHSDGTWSEAPSCKATFCSVDTDKNPELISMGVKYIRDGQKHKLPCVKKSYWITDHFYIWQCVDGRSSFSECCGLLGRSFDAC